jgi:hypothetical protein
MERSIACFSPSAYFHCFSVLILKNSIPYVKESNELEMHGPQVYRTAMSPTVQLSPGGRSIDDEVSKLADIYLSTLII